MSFWGFIFSLVLGKDLGVELLGQRADVCFIFKKPADLFPSACTIVHLHHQCKSIPVAPYPHPHFGLLAF